jgi:hypothetical protein
LHLLNPSSSPLHCCAASSHKASDRFMVFIKNKSPDNSFSDCVDCSYCDLILIAVIVIKGSIVFSTKYKLLFIKIEKLSTTLHHHSRKKRSLWQYCDYLKCFKSGAFFKWHQKLIKDYECLIIERIQIRNWEAQILWHPHFKISQNGFSMRVVCCTAGQIAGQRSLFVHLHGVQNIRVTFIWWQSCSFCNGNLVKKR